MNTSPLHRLGKWPPKLSSSVHCRLNPPRNSTMECLRSHQECCASSLILPAQISHASGQEPSMDYTISREPFLMKEFFALAESNGWSLAASDSDRQTTR